MKNNYRMFLVAAVAAVWLIVFTPARLFSQSESQTDKKAEQSKKGLNLGALPAVAFDSDIGFQYGLLANLFQYGDGSVYPDYRWSLYAEWSRTTKGSGINQLFFDSKYLLPHGIRVTADFSFLTEQALDFYGFNGYESVYNPAFTDKDDPEYITRVFYRHERKLGRIILDFQQKIGDLPLRWIAGYSHFNSRIGSVDIEKLNKGRDDEDKLPDVESLYDKYIRWGLLSPEEADGGAHNFLKAGLIFDTRDNEPNPNRGVWSDVVLMTAPGFLGNKEANYTKLALTHRHYITLKKDILTFAYRLGWQGTIQGEGPFYMQPYMLNSFTKSTKNDGLGGARSLRGILRNRVVGDAFTYGNFEMRYKFLKFYKWKQNFYLSLNGFSDMGMVTKTIDVDWDKVPAAEREGLYEPMKQGLHISYGAGLRIAMNQNFIVAVDYGLAGDKRDGKSGMYINLGFMF